MIVIASTVSNVEKILLNAFEHHAPPESFCSIDDVRAKQATTAACWFPDMQYLNTLPNLKLIHSMAAGVEHLNINELLPEQRVCRIINQQHQQGMFDYLLYYILYYQRCFDHYQENQHQQKWIQYPQKTAADLKIGILGLGHLGKYIAEKLASLHYEVFGWASSPKQIKGVQCFSGQEELNTFLPELDILINLLPLTTQTEGILSAQLFKHLPSKAVVINTGRGAHLNATDLITYLDRNQLRGAVLDVFEQEPLDPNNPLWMHPKVRITPHIASHASLKIVVEQILENDRRLLSQSDLLNEINISRGY